MERWKKRSRRGERRILTVIAVITILIVIALIAFYIWGPRILESIGTALPAKTESVPATNSGTVTETVIPALTESIPVPVKTTTAHPDVKNTVDRQKMSFVIATPSPEANDDTQ